MPEPDPKNHRVLIALRHSLRRRILNQMKNSKPVSPRELADALGEPLSNVSYHVRILAETGAVTEVRRRQVRGATQHFYRRVLKSKWAEAVLRGTDDEPAKRKGKRKPKNAKSKKPPKGKG